MKKVLVILTIVLLLISGCSSKNEPGDNKVPQTGDKQPDKEQDISAKQESSLKEALQSMSSGNVDVLMQTNLIDASKNSDMHMQIRNAGKDTMEMKASTVLDDVTILYYLKDGKLYADMNGMKFILPSDEDFGGFDATENFNSEAFQDIDYKLYKVSETPTSYLYTSSFTEDNPFAAATDVGTIIIEIDKKTSQVISTIIESGYEDIKSTITMTYDNLAPIEFPDLSEFTSLPG